MKRLAATVLAVLMLSGCTAAINRFVVIPTPGQDLARVEQDKQECEVFALANRNNQEALVHAGLGTAVGAGGGAALGAVSGAFRGGAGQGAGYGAAVGAVGGLVVGLIGGITQDHQRYLRVYQACLRQRGYTVAG